MTNLIPKKFLSFPTMSLSDFWGEDEDWLLNNSSQSGLSVYEDEKKIYVEAAIPGIDPQKVDITFHEGYLWIRGENKEEEEDKKKKYYRKAVSSFSYRVAVPGDIDIDREPEASCKNGVMTVSFTKSPKMQPKKIQVKVK